MDADMPVKGRRWLLAGAIAAVMIALLLPTHWYDTIPRHADLKLPFRGVTLLRLTFVFEALVLAWAGLRGFAVPRLDARMAAVIPRRSDVSYDISRPVALSTLAVVTLLGLWLRTHNLGQDLWLDEISPLVDYTKLSAVQIMGSYLRSNNHLLNTIILKTVVSVFGEHEWSVRLAAVSFGVLTVPAIYWLGRVALSRTASLGAAFVLALSYHHVFFSQNARGYTSYILFALLSTGFLIEALRDDRLRNWTLYIVSAVLGSASLLIMAFVITAHVILCLVVATRIRRAGYAIRPLMVRIVIVCGITGFLAFQVYSAALPEVYVVLTTIYSVPSTGYAPFSAEFFGEMIRGIAVGFGSPLFVLTFFAISAAGFAALSVICWPLAVSLTLPAVLTATVLGARGLTFSPRFFLLLLPLVILSAAAAMQFFATAAWNRHVIDRRIAVAGLLVGMVLLGSAAGRSLPYYFRTPKQPYRTGLVVAQFRDPGGRIVVVGNAALGFRYYSTRMPGIDTARISYAFSSRQFDSLTRMPSAGPPQVLSTFSRALRMELPEINDRLQREWKPDTTFAATIGDGEVILWSRRDSPPLLR